MREELGKIKTALHLMNSIILSGEEHSAASTLALTQAALAIEQLEARPEAAQVRVKPLAIAEQYAELTIETDFGDYVMRENPMFGKDTRLLSMPVEQKKYHIKLNGMFILHTNDANEFLRICQADYERRIRAALEPDTVTGWQDIAKKLFCALDDIDTADDIAKDNEKLYRNLVRKAHKVRFEFQKLFDLDGDVSSFNQPPLPPAPEKEG